MTINDIRRLQAERGWTDETLLDLLLNRAEACGEDAVETLYLYLRDEVDA